MTTETETIDFPVLRMVGFTMTQKRLSASFATQGRSVRTVLDDLAGTLHSGTLATLRKMETMASLIADHHDRKWVEVDRTVRGSLQGVTVDIHWERTVES